MNIATKGIHTQLGEKIYNDEFGFYVALICESGQDREKTMIAKGFARCHNLEEIMGEFLLSYKKGAKKGPFKRILNEDPYVNPIGVVLFEVQDKSFWDVMIEDKRGGYHFNVDVFAKADIFLMNNRPNALTIDDGLNKYRYDKLGIDICISQHSSFGYDLRYGLNSIATFSDPSTLVKAVKETYEGKIYDIARRQGRGPR